MMMISEKLQKAIDKIKKTGELMEARAWDFVKAGVYQPKGKFVRGSLEYVLMHQIEDRNVLARRCANEADAMYEGHDDDTVEARASLAATLFWLAAEKLYGETHPELVPGKAYLEVCGEKNRQGAKGAKIACAEAGKK